MYTPTYDAYQQSMYISCITCIHAGIAYYSICVSFVYDPQPVYK